MFLLTNLHTCENVWNICVNLKISTAVLRRKAADIFGKDFWKIYISTCVCSKIDI